MKSLRYGHLAQTWKEEYESGLSLSQIGRCHDVRFQTVQEYLIRMGVPRRSLEITQRKHPIRANCFDAPLSSEAAYWLGLLYADGGIMVGTNGGKSVGLTAHSNDIESIQGFLAFVGRTDGYINYRKDKKAISTAVGSKTLINRLAELGCVPRKTHIIRWPEEITGDLSPHFIRGYFDGDGCIGFYLKARYKTPQGKFKLTGNPRFISDVACKIKQHIGINVSGTSKGGSIPGNTISISYEGRDQLIILHDWLYSKGGPCLSRKKATFDNGLAYVYVRPTRTHCLVGHAMSEDNVYTYPSGTRVCRQCMRIADRKFKAKKKAGYVLCAGEIALGENR